MPKIKSQTFICKECKMPFKAIVPVTHCTTCWDLKSIEMERINAEHMRNLKGEERIPKYQCIDHLMTDEMSETGEHTYMLNKSRAIYDNLNKTLGQNDVYMFELLVFVSDYFQVTGEEYTYDNMLKAIEYANKLLKKVMK